MGVGCGNGKAMPFLLCHCLHQWCVVCQCAQSPYLCSWVNHKHVWSASLSRPGSVSSSSMVSRAYITVRLSLPQARTHIQWHDGKTGDPQLCSTMNEKPQNLSDPSLECWCLKVAQCSSPSLFMPALLIGRGPPAGLALGPTLRLSGHPYRSQVINCQAVSQGYRGCYNSREHTAKVHDHFLTKLP